MRLLTGESAPRPIITRRRLLAAAGVTSTCVFAESLRRYRLTAHGLPAGRLKTLVEDFDCAAAPPAVARSVRNLLVLSLGESKRTDVVKGPELQSVLESIGLGAQTVRGATAKAAATRLSVRILVGGEVRSIASGYRLAIRATDATSGRVLLPEYAVSAKAEDLSGAVARMGEALRRFLGEPVALAQFAAPVPEQVDTARADALESFTLGLSFYKAGEYDAAIAKLTEATSLDPEFAVAYMYQAVVHYAMQQDNLALAPSAEAYKLRNKLNTHGSVYVEFLHLLSLGDREAANERLQTLVRFFPDDPNLNRQVSQGFAILEKPDIALNYARRAAQLDPTDPFNVNLYASGLAENGRPEEGAQVLRTALAQSPDAPVLLFGEAYLAMLRLDETAAISTLHAIINRGALVIPCRVQKIKALILSGRLDEVVRQIETELPSKEVAGEAPTIDTYRYWLGQIAAVRGDTVTCGQQAVALGEKEAIPPSLRALRMGAELAWISGRADVLAATVGKLGVIDRIHTSARSSGFVRFAEALTESAGGRAAEAVDVMRKAEALWPDLTTKWAFGELLLERELLAEAETRFREVTAAKASALRFWGVNLWIRSLARLAGRLEQIGDPAARDYRSQFDRIWGAPSQYRFTRVPSDPRSRA
jgi:tetratricopeptide (TPR) repeat protein